MFRCLVSALLLAFPVGTTIGLLMGIHAINRMNGKPPPFAGSDDTGGLPGVGPIRAKDVMGMRCDTADGVYSNTKNGLDFSLTANPWGWQEGEPGNICLLVNLNGNRTYATKWSCPVFNVTWQYPRATGTNNVHAFPNAKIMSKALPAQAETIKTLDLDVKWSLSLNNDSSQVTEVTAEEISVNAINANVAVDMFFDKDADKASNPAQASHEIMVWFAQIGTDTFPIGKKSLTDTGLKTMNLNGTEFYLYFGENKVTKQSVLTWVTSKPAQTFSGSLKALVDEIFAFKSADYPSPTFYLGYLAFGQEAYSSKTNVTFSVSELSIDLETQ